MGLSASQARLLSITARLSDNELQSQQIANAKVRLADQSQEASREYVNALDTQKLMYTMYDAKGNATKVNLTPAVMYDYSELKNQYGISNNAGQLLVSAADAANYKNSDNIYEFLECYGYDLPKDSEYTKSLEILFGTNYTNAFDISNLSKYSSTSQFVQMFNSTIANLDTKSISSSVYIAISSNFKRAFNSVCPSMPALTEEEKDQNISVQDKYGLIYQLKEAIDSMPSYAAEPTLWDYSQSILSPQCWGSRTGSTGSGIYKLIDNPDGYIVDDGNIYHIEHVLSQYLWDTTEASDMTVTYNGRTETIHKNGGTGTNKYGLSAGGGDGTDNKNVRGVLKTYPELKEKLQVLYYQVCNYLKNSCTSSAYAGIPNGTITENGNIPTVASCTTAEAKNAAIKKIGADYYTLMKELLVEVATDILTSGEDDPRYASSGLDNYITARDNYLKFENYDSWVVKVQNLLESFTKISDNLPLDSEDSKAQWYINLWHRMNGESNIKMNDTSNTDGTSGRYWKILDDASFKSSSWLQYNLEQGLITLEQVQRDDDVETETGLKNVKWQPKTFTSCTDIQFVDDETAVARAEAVYTKKLNEIEAKDKKYDSDIKKLDTEHNALQTEYDSVKSVIDKNIERSFKAFS